MSSSTVDSDVAEKLIWICESLNVIVGLPILVLGNQRIC